MIASGETTSVEVTSLAHRPPRGGRAAGQCLPHRHLGAGDAQGGRGRCCDQGGREARPPRRRPAGAQGHHLHQGDPDHRRLQDAQQLRAALLGDRRRAAGRRRHPDAGQDQPRRVCDGLIHRELRLPADPQPLGPLQGARRLVGRQRGCGGLRPGDLGARYRHRREHPPAGRSVRRRRAEADLRSGLPVRADRIRLLAGPGGAVHPGRA